MIDIDHLNTPVLRDILAQAIAEQAEEPTIKLLWELNLRTDNGEDNLGAEWLDERVGEYGQWFGGILAQVRHRQQAEREQHGQVRPSWMVDALDSLL